MLFWFVIKMEVYIFVINSFAFEDLSNILKNQMNNG